MTKFLPTTFFGLPTADLKDENESDSTSEILPTAHLVPLGLTFSVASDSHTALKISPPDVPRVMATLLVILS